ncbi:MAG TPA: hypothetical protein DCE58_04960, partial [Cryomorphaceae bacterium]|nr:hypothetical protein [Cryomorphaceae bacterium]
DAPVAPARSAAPNAPAPGAPRTPVTTGKKIGRNDLATIANIVSGEKKQVKFKVAEPLLSQGWTLLKD